MLALGLGFVVLQATNAGEAISSKSLLDFNFQIPLPGLPTQVSGADVAAGKLLPMYFVAIYGFLLRAAGIFAVLMLMYAGIRWLTAGGDSSHTTEAKKIMGDALFGLLLALGSYTFLYTINPDLVDTKAVKPDGISSITVDIEKGTFTADPSKPGACCFAKKTGTRDGILKKENECISHLEAAWAAGEILEQPMLYCALAEFNRTDLQRDRVCVQQQMDQCLSIKDLSPLVAKPAGGTPPGGGVAPEPSGVCCIEEETVDRFGEHKILKREELVPETKCRSYLGYKQSVAGAPGMRKLNFCPSSTDVSACTKGWFDSVKCDGKVEIL